MQSIDGIKTIPLPVGKLFSGQDDGRGEVLEDCCARLVGVATGFELLRTEVGKREVIVITVYGDSSGAARAFTTVLIFA